MGTVMKPGAPSMLLANRGMALLMTLVTLTILTISSLSMMMLMKSGATAAGNIAFRQAAVRVADLAVEDARSWLLTQSATTLQNDVPGVYYASYQPTFAPQNFAFTDNAQATKFVSGGNDTFSGYKIYYVIHRMAATAGVACTDPSAQCVMPPTAATSTTGSGSSHAAGSGYQPQITGTTGLVYYRVTAKVVGPRFNNRYVQAFFY